MHHVDDVLRGRAFVAGDAFSKTDTLIGGSIFAGVATLAVSSECDALQARYARMGQRPSVQNRVTMSDPAS